MTCKISTLDKKSIGCTETFEKIIDGETYRVDLEQWWRWGYVIVDENADEIDVSNPDGLIVTDLSINDQSFDDGVSLYFYFSQNMTDELKKEVEELWDDEGYWGLEEAGWEMIDTETVFHGPLEVENLGDTVEEEEQPDDGKPKWPFS